MQRVRLAYPHGRMHSTALGNEDYLQRLGEAENRGFGALEAVEVAAE